MISSILLFFRTDNAIKNHFYCTLRKLISRVQKDEIPPEMSKNHKCFNAGLEYDEQLRSHTSYLIKYLKNLISLKYFNIYIIITKIVLMDNKSTHLNNT
jgi:hypothetical protein